MAFVPPRNTFEKMCNMVYTAIDTPITWFRENVVERNREPYPYYHRKLNRVPTIDQCYKGEVACFYEANLQYKTDKRVDAEIINILRQRKESCVIYEYPEQRTKCAKILEDYEQAAENYFIKYGDLGYHGNVIDAFMKQKHRLIWERRHPKSNVDQVTE